MYVIFLAVSILSSLIYIYSIITVLKKNEINPIIVTYIIFLIEMSIWSISFTVFHFSQNSEYSLIGYRLGSIGYCSFYAFLLHFTIQLHFEEKSAFFKTFYILIYNSSLLFTILFMTDDLSFLDFKYNNGIRYYYIESIEPWFIFYLLCSASCILISFYLLYQIYLSPSNRRKPYAKKILITQSVTTCLCLLTNIIVPIFHITFIPEIAEIFSLIYLIGIEYFITNYCIINITPEIASKQIVSKVNDMIIITDQAGRIIFINESSKIILGYKEKNILGIPIQTIFWKDSDDIKKIDVNNLNEKVFDIYLVLASQQKIPAKVSASAIMEKSKLIGIAFVMQDMRMVYQLKEEILKKEELTEILMKKNEQLKELDKLKSEFICNISHELRTPLNLMMSSIQLIKKLDKSQEQDDKKQVKYLNIILQNSYRLTRLVNNIIDVTKIEAGYLPLNLSNNNIVKVVEDITLSIAEYIQNKGVNLTFDTDIEERIIACDPDKIERIMLNIIGNAVKFTGEGGDIFVNLYDDDKNIRIEVKDTGIGISKEDLKNIFDRFIQVDKTLSRQHEGSGIGLSLVKSLVEMHGGTISVESLLGVGSTFIITLPVYLIDEEKEIVDELHSESKLDKVNLEFSDIYF